MQISFVILTVGINQVKRVGKMSYHEDEGSQEFGHDLS